MSQKVRSASSFEFGEIYPVTSEDAIPIPDLSNFISSHLKWVSIIN
jgi:hypothetical protein